MSGSSVVAVVVAVLVSAAGFAGVTASAPVGYPEDSLLRQGLVRGIVFDAVSYESPAAVRGRLVLINPGKTDVGFIVEYPVRCEVYLESRLLSSEGLWGVTGSSGVTVPTGGEYTVAPFSFEAYGPGYYEVDWGGLRRGVYVDAGDVVPRLVTEKDVYGYGANGYLTFEYYNPKPYPVNFTHPSKVILELWIDGVDQQTGFGAFLDYFDSNAANAVLQPGEAVKIISFYFTTYEPGSVTYSGMGASKTIRVLPR